MVNHYQDKPIWLLIKEDIEPQLGDNIFYVNNGTRKSHGDIQVRKRKTDPPEGTLIFNSYLISSEQMEKNPNLKGEYNVAKYLDAFNKKVEPLLVYLEPILENLY